MSHLSEIYLKKEVIETLLKVANARNLNGISVTISTNDEAKSFTGKDGKEILQNVSAYVSQTKEDREAKKPRYYVGNGKVFWSDGSPCMVPGAKAEEVKPQVKEAIEDSDSLPF